MITTLALSGNQIKDDGAIVLVKALKINKKLIFSSLSRNQIKENSTIAIAEALASNE